jgi:two-component system sensor histidine kinase VicK
MNLSSILPEGELLRQIAERSLSVFFLYNLHTGRFEYVSPAFEDVWGREEEGINEQLDWLLSTVHPDDLPRLETSYGQLQTNSFRQFLEFRLRREQREKWIHLTAFCILEGGKRKAIAGFAEDITHFKQNEIKANLFSVQKNGVLEMLAHDLNGPLGMAQKLAEKLASKAQQRGQPDMEADADLIHKTVSHGIHLIHDLLEKEFLESSQTALKRQRIDLVEQVQSMLASFERMDQDDHKHFEFEASAAQIFVRVDQTKFMQAIVNLVANANKFTHNNGHIRVAVQEKAGNVTISVRDDGIGIPKDLQPQLFERFTKARRPGLKGEETVGLGLSIVKRIVELHGGKIWVESQENKGAAFFIELPGNG